MTNEFNIFKLKMKQGGGVRGVRELFRVLLREVGIQVTTVRGDTKWRQYVANQFYMYRGEELESSETQRRMEFGRSYLLTLKSVREQQELLTRYNIVPGRGKDRLRKEAARAGLQLPMQHGEDMNMGTGL